MSNKRVRIKLVSTDIDKINKVSSYIKDVADKTGVALRGPIPLPTQKLRIATRKAPNGAGSATWDRFEMRIHKRILDIASDDRALRLVMRVEIPEGLHIHIKQLDE